MTKILSSNFLFNIINFNIKNYNEKIFTRFAPEANSFLHLGHIKIILINLELSKIYNGNCKLRIDDTNPINNKNFYIKNIKKDIKWLTKYFKISFNKKIFYTSNYFNKLYQYLEIYKKFIKYYKIIKLRKIRLGFYKERDCIIRLKEINLIIYRIKYIKHFRINYLWFIFPLYDWAHTISDKIENINYSLCSSEFINNKLFYNWIMSNIIYKNIFCKQIELSKLKFKNIITSKRSLNILKKKKYIKSLQDPRIYSIKGLKSRYIKQIDLYLFLKNLNITKNDSILNKVNIKINKINMNYKINNNYINNKIKLKLINFVKLKLIKFKTKIINLYLDKLILIENVFCKHLHKTYFLLTNFKINLKLKNLKFIKCKNYKKNKFGIIKYFICKYKNIKIRYKNNEKQIWINNRFKNLIYLEIYNKLLYNSEKSNFALNTKSKQKLIIDSENIIKNYIIKIFYLKILKNCILHKNFLNSDKINKIKFQINKI